ncbi:hypothetical protein Ancab_030045 [Ancistrocladus abbreviatus]
MGNGPVKEGNAPVTRPQGNDSSAPPEGGSRRPESCLRLTAMGGSKFPLSLLFLLFIQLSSRASAIRKDTGLQARKCINTVQGRYLLSDDNGFVCDALSMDPESRCCPKRGEQFSCHGCNLVSQCCNSYEFCVSCCLNPSQTQKELALQVKVGKPVTAGTTTSQNFFSPHLG